MTSASPRRSPVRIAVPASSANVGPGYDTFGLALAKYDEIVAARTPSGLEIEVEGVGAATVPRDERNLVMQAALRAFAAMGEPVPGLRLTCVNRIPHGGGQGSSAAAIVAGILMARSVTDDGAHRLPDDAVFALATAMEGHPDNVAPALFGGFTIAWMATTGMTTEPGGAAVPHAVRLAPHREVRAVAFTADAACSTSAARAALPAMIPHADAAANSARAALLVHAVTADPSLLFDATEDYLHQSYRAAVMPESAALLGRLRARGLAAVLSGAGPSVLLLGVDLPDAESLAAPGFHVEALGVPSTGVLVDGAPLPHDTP